MSAVSRHVAFSGGRSSAYMLHRLLEEHGGLPERVRVVFANTGKEREETLSFVRRCAEEWGVEIHWVEYRYRAAAKGGRADPKNHYAEVDFASASRHGEPFAQMVRAKRRLPNAFRRLCTDELKVTLAKRYLRRAHGWRTKGPGFRTLLGIRYDEPRRWRKGLMEECDTEYPLVERRVTARDVAAFWRSHPFDLALPYEEGWSNCDMCFLKPARVLASIAQREPGRLAWWEALEDEAVAFPRKVALRKAAVAQFDPRRPYRDLRTAQSSLALDEDGQLPASCYCGD